MREACAELQALHAAKVAEIAACRDKVMMMTCFSDLEILSYCRPQRSPMDSLIPTPQTPMRSPRSGDILA